MVSSLERSCAAARRLDGVEVADEVGDGDVGRGELLHVAIVRGQPGDGRGVAALGDQVAAALADGVVGIVANLAPGDVGQALVEQGGESAQDAAFCLSAQAKQDEVLPREDRIHNLRNDGVFIADDSRKDGFAGLQARDQVAPHLVLDGAGAEQRFREDGAGTQFPESKGKRVSCGHCGLLRAG